jgi:hypothetical protein
MSEDFLVAAHPLTIAKMNHGSVEKCEVVHILEKKSSGCAVINGEDRAASVPDPANASFAGRIITAAFGASAALLDAR